MSVIVVLLLADGVSQDERPEDCQICVQVCTYIYTKLLTYCNYINVDEVYGKSMKVQFFYPA